MESTLVKQVELRKYVRDNVTYSDILLQEEISYTPEEALELTRQRLENNKYKKNFHKEDPEFNPEKHQRKYKKQLRLPELTKLLKSKTRKIPYSIPEKLYNRINQIIKTEYFAQYSSQDKRKKRTYETRLDQALYLCIAILHFNQTKRFELKQVKNRYKRKNQEFPEEEQIKIRLEYDTEIGCELSKNILTKIINNKDLYEIKNVLYKYKIIGNVPLLHNYVQTVSENEIKGEKELRNISFYAKSMKEALRYFINPKYLDRI